jgi:hypothetical protein
MMEKKRTRTITGWRQITGRPGIASRRMPAPLPRTTVLETRVAPSESASNERGEDKGRTRK